MGEENFVTGLIPRAHFSASCRSVELDQLNQLLNDGIDIGGAEISASVLLRLANAPGFEEWYQDVVSKGRGGAMPPNKRLQWSR